MMVQFGYRRLEIWPPQIESCRTDELRQQLVQYAKSLGLTLVRLNAAAADYSWSSVITGIVKSAPFSMAVASGEATKTTADAVPRGKR